ncbi:unnamed protein product [Calypogeia fissa]
MTVINGQEQEAASNGVHYSGNLENSGAGGGEPNWASGLKNLVVKTGLLGHSDASFDAWLTACAAQIGQVVLTIPTTLAQMGYAWGVVALIGYGFAGWWMCYLLQWMFFEYKAKLERHQNPSKEKRVIQYHDVIRGVAGQPLGYITFCFIILSLFLAGVIQLVSSASNVYYANDHLNKRQWTFVAGAISMLSIFLPNFRHFRGISFLGVATTTVAAVYFVIAAFSHGQRGHITHTGPKANRQFFTGMTNTIFVWGGHGVTIEIIDAMKRPKTFKYLYLGVVVYSLSVILPSSIAVYWAYGDQLLTRGNAFAVLQPSGWRTFAISCMILHQIMVYIIYMVSVFIALEKIVGVHNGRYIWRTLVRIPLVLAVWVVALAIPFFGLINSVMGAFIVTFSIYVVPPVAFFIHYRTAAARESSVEAPPLIVGRSWAVLFIVNGIIAALTLTIGLGWGGWASIKTVIDNIHTFGFFAPCYQCPPKK